jgi:hypothetical protein
MEMRMIRRTLLQHVEVRAPTEKPERPVHTRRLTACPAKGARVTVTTRKA